MTSLSWYICTGHGQVLWLVCVVVVGLCCGWFVLWLVHVVVSIMNQQSGDLVLIPGCTLLHDFQFIYIIYKTRVIASEFIYFLNPRLGTSSFSLVAENTLNNGVWLTDQINNSIVNSKIRKWTHNKNLQSTWQEIWRGCYF